MTVNRGSFVNPDALDARLRLAEDYLREIEMELARSVTNIDSQASRHRAPLENQIAEARTLIEERRNAR